MNIEWIEKIGWSTTAEDAYEDLEVCLKEREIAIKYWTKELK